MKKLYYFVPICPVCASRRTGRYVLPPMRDKHYMMMESLKNGEIIKYKSPEPIKNAFCLDCGHNFIADINLIRMSDDEIEEERYRRGTDDLLDAYIEKNHIDLNKKPPLGGLFSGLLNF